MQIAAGRTLSEVEVDDYLTGRRAAQGGFIEPSFPTIAGSGPHGAIIHYRAQPDTCGTVSASQLLLVDSGARLQCHPETHAQPCLSHQLWCRRDSKTSSSRGRASKSSHLSAKHVPGIAVLTAVEAALCEPWWARLRSEALPLQVASTTVGPLTSRARSTWESPQSTSGCASRASYRYEVLARRLSHTAHTALPGILCSLCAASERLPCQAADCARAALSLGTS